MAVIHIKAMNEHVQKMFDLSVTLKDKLHPKLAALENKYGSDDFRTQLIGRPMNALIIQILTFKANQVTFYNHDWWDSVGVPEEGRKGFVEKHDTFLKFLSFIQFFSYVESQLRVVIKRVSPGSCKDGKASFESIYKKILSDLALSCYIETFDLASCVRNSIHTAGVYLPTNNTDNRTLNFKGRQYKFTYDKEIDFVFPEVIVEIEEEIYDCLLRIIAHKDIESML